jgi:peptidoglycan-associated lipoprotein
MARGSLAQWWAAAACLLVFGLVGCASKGTTQSGQGSTKPASEFDEGPVSDSSDKTASIKMLETVYFDYDRHEIRSDARPVLRKNADAIQKNEGWGVVVVEGHCDERGSEEYNLALGERRANGVKRYLVDLGVPSSRLRTVSFGEAKPAVMGHDESAWRYNRRSEFKGSQ